MLFWAYDLSSGTLALLTVAVFVNFGIGGLLAARWLLGRGRRHVIETNDIIGFYFTAVIGFYGITLGLISVGVWQTFSDADAKSTLEAAAIEALYRDVSAYPEPPRSAMQAELKSYTQEVIDKDWPEQRKGLTPTGGTASMTALQQQMFPFEPHSQGQMAVHQEALRQYNRLTELRRLRILGATAGLPDTIWVVVLLGAAASVVLTWLFTVESIGRHMFLTGLYSGLLGLLIFLIAALDSPYRGEVSISPEAFRHVLDHMGKM